MKTMKFEYMNINHVEDMPDETTVERYAEIIRDRYKPRKETRVFIPEPLDPVSFGDLKVLKAPGVGWFDVIDKTGLKLNSKGLRRVEAEQMAADLHRQSEVR